MTKLLLAQWNIYVSVFLVCHAFMCIDIRQTIIWNGLSKFVKERKNQTCTCIASYYNCVLECHFKRQITTHYCTVWQSRMILQPVSLKHFSFHYHPLLNDHLMLDASTCVWIIYKEVSVTWFSK